MHAFVTNGKVTATTLLKVCLPTPAWAGGAGYVGFEQAEICFAVSETVGQLILGFVGNPRTLLG